MNGFFGDALLIARKDLAIEFRTRSAFLSVLVFALLGIVIFYFAWDPTAVSAVDLAPGVLWVIFTFSGLLGLHRSFGVEQEEGAIDGLLASPVSREAIFLGKAGANLVCLVRALRPNSPMCRLNLQSINSDLQRNCRERLQRGHLRGSPDPILFGGRRRRISSDLKMRLSLLWFNHYAIA